MIFIYNLLNGYFIAQMIEYAYGHAITWTKTFHKTFLVKLAFPLESFTFFVGYSERDLEFRMFQPICTQNWPRQLLRLSWYFFFFSKHITWFIMMMNRMVVGSNELADERLKKSKRLKNVVRLRWPSMRFGY